MQDFKLSKLVLHQSYYDYLSNSLTDYQILSDRTDLSVPIIVNTNNELVNGYHRIIKARLLGKDSLPAKIYKA